MENRMSTTEDTMSNDLKTRLGGLLAIAIGAAVFWFFILWPLQRAQAGVEQINLELKAFALVPLCLVFGLAFLVLGDRFDYRTAKHDNLTPRGWAFFVVVMALTGLGYWWFSSQFSALGYQ